MTPERYSQVKSLFQLLLDQPPAQRPDFLQRACGADRDLYNQVRDLLRSDSTSEDFLEKPALTPLSQVLADAAAESQEVPARIGPYAVQKLLGNGGMGAVYLAHRADKSYNKQMAIKVIHKGMESDRILERFRRERQIIASLDHPNIARLLDGGATEDGRPYIVMEYVEGMTITNYCDYRRLTTERRLQIFLQVCEAVEYAHRNLIIHRDIKPGNILVRADNTVKLLDFGIAKLMSPDTTALPSEKTATSMRLMTPQYASPEQVRGEPVTTASDIYLLGIVLYELLTGHRPYEVNNNAAQEALRAYSQGEPQKPSDAIFRITEKTDVAGKSQAVRNALTVSAVREANPAVLRKKLEGALDAILLRALRRNATERYPSTAQFALDIRNYLAQFPVSALPDSTTYRLRLFLRRNMAVTLSGAAIVTLLLLITVFAVLKAVSAQSARVRAEAHLGEATKLADALLFEGQDSLGSVPGATRARRVLLQKTLSYLSGLAGDPNADPALQRELALRFLRAGHLQGNPDYANLGDTEGAMATYTRALSLLEPLHRDQPKDAQISGDLADGKEAMAAILTAEGDPGSAVPLLRTALELRESGNSPPELKSAVYHHLATALADTGATSEALTLARRANDIAATFTGADARRQRALTASRHGQVLRRTGDLDGAASSYRKAVSLFEELAAVDPLAARAKRELSAAVEDLAATEPPMLAIEHFQRALQLRRDLASAEPGQVQPRRELAYTFLRQGAAPEAIEGFRQISLQDSGSILARRDLALAWSQLADSQRKAGKFAESLESYRQQQRIVREWMEREPGDRAATKALAVTQVKLAHSLAQTGELPEAIRSAEAAMRLVSGLLEKQTGSHTLQALQASAEWELGRALADFAHVSNEPADWKKAVSALESAAASYAALDRRQPLTGEARSTPAAISAHMATCRQALAALPMANAVSR